LEYLDFKDQGVIAGIDVAGEVGDGLEVRGRGAKEGSVAVVGFDRSGIQIEVDEIGQFAAERAEIADVEGGASAEFLSPGRSLA
jgi:hypothetical protein